MVLERFENAGFKLNYNKYKFMQDEVRFLGHVVDKHGLRKTHELVEAISLAPIPKDLSEVRSFLGMVNYYASFIRDFSNKLEPIYHLLKKGVALKWNKKFGQAFRVIKADMVKDVTLVDFDARLLTILSRNASSYGIGAVLSQIKDGEKKDL